MKLSKKQIQEKQYKSFLRSKETFNSIHSIYVLYCPIKKQIVYVGMTSLPLTQRLKMHLWEANSNSYFNKREKEWLKELQDLGLSPLIRRVAIANNRDIAKKKELKVIVSIMAKRELLNFQSHMIRAGKWKHEDTLNKYIQKHY